MYIYYKCQNLEIWTLNLQVGVASFSVRKQMSYRASLSRTMHSSAFSTSWCTERVALYGSTTVSETLGEGKTENVSIMRSGYSSLILEIRRVPIPEPVPPPKEWQTWNPAQKHMELEYCNAIALINSGGERETVRKFSYDIDCKMLQKV